MSKIMIKESGLCLELNHSDFTASIIYSPKAKGEVFIPRSISHESHEFVIKKIKGDGFKSNRKIKYLKFADDSEISSFDEEVFAGSSLISINIPKNVTNIPKSLFNSCEYLKDIIIPEDSMLTTIGSYAFAKTQIESFTFSDNIEKLEEGWCDRASKLTKIIISPKNKNFSYLNADHKIIVGKSDPIFTYFDVIVFASRDLKEVTIPNDIRHINDYSFSECKNLEKVEFDTNSLLLSIGKNAFSKSALKSIMIPSTVNEIKEACFAETKLEFISIHPKNNKFALIEGKLIVAKSDINSMEYDVVVFALDKFTNVIIPSFIKTIGPFSFYKNKKLSFVLFTENSQLTSIEEAAFQETSLSLIQIPKHVKKIGLGAFSTCKELQKVEFPQDSELEIIDEGSFYESSIESILIPTNVKSIGPFAFGRCMQLNEVLFPVDSKLELIDKSAFACSGIKVFYLPENVKKIEEGSFASCTELESFYFPKNGKLEIIGERAFDSSSINSLKIPNYVKEIKKYAFFNCYQLYDVDIQNDSQLKMIDECVFDNCPLRGIEIPSGIQLIKKSAFADCTDFCNVVYAKKSELESIEKNSFSNTLIEEMDLPSNLKELSGSCFANVPLNTIKISKQNKYLSKLHDNVVLKKSEQSISRADTVLFGYNQIEEMKVPSNIKHIAPYAFYMCYDFSSIIFTKNSELLSIGKNAFVSTSLKSIVIPKQVRKIEKKTFLDCSNLEKVEFVKDSELQLIEKEAFCNSSINYISIPDQVKELDYCWCSNTANLIHIVLSPGNKNFAYLDKNKKIIVGKSDQSSNEFDSIYIACRDITEVTIPSNIKYIKTFAFENCKKLKSLKFEENSQLVSIERNAFSNTEINNFTAPKSLKEINKKAFSGCKNLSKIAFPDDSLLWFIGKRAFESTSIVDIKIPPLVEKVGENLFENCSKLKTASFLSVKFFIDKDCFNNCEKLKTVSLPNAMLVMKENDPNEKEEKKFVLKLKDGAELV